MRFASAPSAAWDGTWEIIRGANAASIRFYADEGGAGNHPRQSAGIRFYADEGRSGKSSATKRRHPLLRR